MKEFSVQSQEAGKGGMSTLVVAFEKNRLSILKLLNKNVIRPKLLENEDIIKCEGLEKQERNFCRLQHQRFGRSHASLVGVEFEMMMRKESFQSGNRIHCEQEIVWGAVFYVP